MGLWQAKKQNKGDYNKSNTAHERSASMKF